MQRSSASKDAQERGEHRNISISLSLSASGERERRLQESKQFLQEFLQRENSFPSSSSSSSCCRALDVSASNGTSAGRKSSLAPASLLGCRRQILLLFLSLLLPLLTLGPFLNAAPAVSLHYVARARKRERERKKTGI